MGRDYPPGKGKIMDGNVRGLVYTVTDFPKEAQTMTLREAVEWFKTIGTNVKDPNFAEIKYMNERWAHLCTELAKREGVPPGYMSYFLNELAVSEMQVASTAIAEAEVVT